jgi:hypothetical protein
MLGKTTGNVTHVTEAHGASSNRLVLARDEPLAGEPPEVRRSGLFHD